MAAFDTRIDARTIKGLVGVLFRTFVKDMGYAAPRIDAALTQAGGQRATIPAGFIVEGTEGPLRAGELERAGEWARNLA
ncbi:MAG: hypothetical protein IT326_05775 [Anaerolineae bacterium]|nr:hypothetical protein [Anaerolineae bacterium]